MGRIYTAATMVNGRTEGKGPPPMPPLWPLEIAAENQEEKIL